MAELSLPFQIVFGSVVLGLCSLLQFVLLVGAVLFFADNGKRFDTPYRGSHWGMLTVAAFTTVVLAHAIQACV